MPALGAELRDGCVAFGAHETCWVELAGGVPRVVIRRGPASLALQTSPLQTTADGYTARCSDPELRLDLRCEPRADAWILQLTVENQSTGSLSIEELAPLWMGPTGQVRVGAGMDRWSVFRNGYQSWSGARAYRMDEIDRDPVLGFLRTTHTDARHPSVGRAGALRSDLFTVVKNLRSGEALCLGFLDARHAFSAIRLDVRSDGLRELAAACDFDGIELAPGARLVSEPLWIAAGFDERALLAQYAVTLGEVMQARVGAQPPVGWCSWYYYFTGVTETDVLRNAEALAAKRARARPEGRERCSPPRNWASVVRGGALFQRGELAGKPYVMVDDGWESAIGDWLAWNEKFPHGMPWLAERIRAAGFDAGIWLAPFIARPESRLFRDHPDWFVRAHAGLHLWAFDPSTLLRTCLRQWSGGEARPRGRPRTAVWNPAWSLWRSAYALDTTHPEALDWLWRLARTLVHEWGYRILKLDFLFAAALPGERYDRGATRAQALRRGLEAIRSGAGEGAFLLGCGCPLGPAVGVVDGMRIGPDVAPFWSNWLSRWLLADRHGVATRNAIRNTLTRAFMHRRWWFNDPDCLMVRDTRTRLTRDEVQSLATVIALTDGMFVMSDAIDELPDERWVLLEQAYSLTGGTPTAVDLFEADIPELLLCERGDERLLGVFNFGEESSTRVVDVGRFGLYEGEVIELWSGRHLAVQDGWIQLGAIPAHGCRLLHFSAGHRPSGRSL